ncbi:hypothetical protein IW147_005987 [Coemansia sp. RSA 720]|nr:hypothetical protein IW147_005987 [Coemansia sp. RSA 720]
MDSTLLPKIDNRTNVDGGSQTYREVGESTRACPSRTASPPLPAGFPLPPAGYESYFEIWAKFWRRCHGSDELSIEMQLEMCKFVRTVENLKKLGEVENNELAYVHDLHVCRGQAVSKLKAAVDPKQSTMFDAAMRQLNTISELYKRTYAEYKSAYDAHILQVEAATKRIEQLLNCEAQLVVTGENDQYTNTPETAQVTATNL